MGECDFWNKCFGWDRFQCDCGANRCTPHYLNHIKEIMKRDRDKYEYKKIQLHKAVDKHVELAKIGLYTDIRR